MAAGKSGTQAGIEFFERKIRPVLAQHCASCHSSRLKSPKGNLRLDSPAGIRRGGDSGPLFSPQKPRDATQSLLYQAVSYSGDVSEMPPKGKLPRRVIADFRRWIEMGAPLPAEKGPSAVSPQKRIDMQAGRRFWSFQPVRKQPLPSIARSDWPRKRIDRFILHRLEQAGLSPSPPAEDRTWLKRVFLDLIGLPPTSAEMQAFLRDRSANAREKVVERLLSSPHYGERWGRHWLDVARYAEDNPTSESTCKPPRFPFPYRDWVIRALNDDLPYDEFVRRQLAADLMQGLPPSEIAATGFLGLSPVYHKEPKLSRDVIRTIVADEWDERIDAVTRGFLGLTVACARCHDHKFDPIRMDDYYALAGVMASTQLVEWPLVTTDTKTAAAVTDTRLAIVDWQLRVNYAQKMVETARKENRPTSVYEKRHEELKRQLAELKNRKLFAGPLTNAVRDAGVWVNGDDPAWTVLDFRPGVPRDLPIFIRGNPARPGKIVRRRFLEVFADGKPRPFQHGSGRLELADAMLNEARGLTARVIVNRVWGWHFGQPLVRTPSNFGQLGDRPSHPALLDDLAARFIEHGWSLKWLHREIVLSATYGQSSRIPVRTTPGTGPSAVSLDPDNRLLWRMNRRRLEPEVWRDRVLFVCGQLDTRMGGPSEDLNKPTSTRRTVYGRVSRQKPADILKLWDFPDAKFHAAQRTLTTTPLQQLYLLNSEFLQQQADHLAAEFADAETTGKTDSAATAITSVVARAEKVRRLFQRILLRDPTAAERKEAVALISPASGASGNISSGAGSRKNWALLVHSLLACNEFLFTD